MSRYPHLEKLTPLLIQVELTEACNLTCRFCYNSQNPKFNNKAPAILERLAEQGVMQVTLTGGEPLLHPDFFRILGKASELFPNVMILSNGSLMDDAAVDRIHEHNVLSVSISLHGDRVTHDKLTGVSGSYARSFRALQSFLERATIPVASNFVLNAANVSDLGSTIQRLGNTGLRFMTITRFVPVGVGKGAADLVLSNRQMVSALRVVDRHLQSGERPHIEIAEATAFCCVPEDLRYLANTCSYGYDRFYVDVSGNLMVCGLSRIALGGNVLQSSLGDIRAASAVHQAFLRDVHLPHECLLCEDYSQCHGGCRAAAMIEGDWNGGRDIYMARVQHLDNGRVSR